MPEVYESCPILVSTSGKTQLFPYRYELDMINDDSGAYSPHTGSQGAPSAASPMSALFSSTQDNQYSLFEGIEFADESPCLTILDQPSEKFRFRYKSEMVGTHGSLMGSKGNTQNRNAPTVKLHNYSGKAIIRCTLFTSSEELRIPHSHKLIRRVGGVEYDDPHDIEISSENGHVATFNGLAIIHTAKKNVKEELVRKLRRQYLENSKRQHPNEGLTIRESTETYSFSEIRHESENSNRLEKQSRSRNSRLL